MQIIMLFNDLIKSISSDKQFYTMKQLFGILDNEVVVTTKDFTLHFGESGLQNFK